MGFYKNIVEGVKRRLSVPAEMTLGGTTVLDYITIDMTSRGKVYTFAKVVDMPVTKAPNYDVHGFNIHPDATISNPERLQACTVHENVTIDTCGEGDLQHYRSIFRGNTTITNCASEACVFDDLGLGALTLQNVDAGKETRVLGDVVFIGAKPGIVKLPQHSTYRYALKLIGDPEGYYEDADVFPSHSSQGEMIKLAHTLIHDEDSVERYCVAPELHKSRENCKCGLYYPLFLLGHDMAINYFMKLANVEPEGDSPMQFVPLQFIEETLKKFYADNLAPLLKEEWVSENKWHDILHKAVGKKVESIDDLRAALKEAGINHLPTVCGFLEASKYTPASTIPDDVYAIHPAGNFVISQHLSH